MKKIGASILFVTVVSIFCGCAKNAVISPAAEQEQIRKALADRVIGTWVLVESTRPGTPSGIGCRLKSYTGTHWMVTQPAPETGLVVFHHGGRYTLEGDILTEKIDFAGASTQAVIGGSGRFRIAVDGDVLKQIDLDRGVYNETWKRCKPTESYTKQEGK